MIYLNYSKNYLIEIEIVIEIDHNYCNYIKLKLK